jgi:hypothetical protein
MQADGNCLYRALAHQCQQQGALQLINSLNPLDAHGLLREKAAAHIEQHLDFFAPFLVDADRDEAASAQIKAICEGIRGVEWGTQVELQALAAELKVYIEVRLVTGLKRKLVLVGIFACHCKLHRDSFASMLINADRDDAASEQTKAIWEGIRGLEWGTRVEVQALVAELKVCIEVRLVISM